MIITCLVVSFVCGYYSRARIYLGPFDPLKIIAFQEAAWATTVFHLSTEGSINEEQASIFWASIILWWISWLGFSLIFGFKYKRTVFLFFEKISKISNKKFAILSFIYIISLSFFLLTSIIFAGGGDNRLGILKIIRPIEGFIVFLTPIIIYLILIDRVKNKIISLVLIALILILIGGKGAILTFLLPITAAEMTKRIRLDRKNIIIISLLLLSGISTSIIINYDADSLFLIINVFVTRLFMEGDVYILAFSNDGLQYVKIKSLFIYVFSPILKIFMVQYDFDQNIGAQIASGFAGFEVITGPNAHWPILALISGYKNNVEFLIVSFIFYTIIILLKLILIRPVMISRLPISILIPFMGFVIQFPQSFFADPPYQFVYIIHALFVSLVLSFIYSIYGKINFWRANVKQI